MRNLIIEHINDKYNDAKLAGLEAPLRSKLNLDELSDQDLLGLFESIIAVLNQKIGYQMARR